MTTKPDYIEKNLELWNARTSVHVTSEFYAMNRFLEGHTSLNSIELDLLGDVTGKSVLHLQCHFGQDTLSLSRMGAKATGVDLSDHSIAKAKELAAQTNQDARFICCNLYDLPQHLHEQFDLVFASYGTVGWLPDLDKWAGLISKYLKPGGRFVFAEFHPFLELFDDDYKTIANSYFNTGPIEGQDQGTYADPNAPIAFDYVWWSHPVSEVVTSLLQAGLELSAFQEFDYSPYNCFRNLEESEPGKYRFPHFGNKFPIVYALIAEKKA